jgi:hypothetical protein
VPSAEAKELQHNVEEKREKPESPQKTHREKLNRFYSANGQNRGHNTEPKERTRPTATQFLRHRVLQACTPYPNNKRKKDKEYTETE